MDKIPINYAGQLVAWMWWSVVAVLAVVGLVICTGCSFASQVFDTDYHREVYIARCAEAGAERPVEIARAILERQLVVGMTIRDAKVSWGSSGWNRLAVAGQTVWIARRGRSRTYCHMSGGRIARFSSYR